MFRHIYLRELKTNVKSAAFYIFFTLFFLITHFFTANTDPTVGIAMPIGKEWHNAPLVIARFFSFMSVYGILITIIFVGRSVTKDFSAGIHDFFFTAPLNKHAYLWGRFLGGFTANLLIFAGIIAGFFTGCLSIDANYYGSFSVSAFILPVGIILIPNLFFAASLFFALATLSRKMVLTYLAGVALLIIYVFISIGLTFVENDVFKILADPFAISSLSALTRYWTISEINTNTMPLSELLLLNRIIWLSISTGIMWFLWRKFNFYSLSEGTKGDKINQEETFPMKRIEILPPMEKVKTDHSPSIDFNKCCHIVWMEFKRMLVNPAFIVIAVMAMVNMALNFYGNIGPFDNNLYPLTSWFLKQVTYLWVYTTPLIIIFSGLLVWRERDHNSHQIYDVLPVPNWIYYLAKLFALMGLVAFYMLMIMMAGVLTQLVIFSWTDLELGLYVKYLFGIECIHYWYLTVLFVLIHNLTPNKSMGFLICTLYFIADMILFMAFGYDNILLRYGYVPAFNYSNLNGFGHYTALIIWYSIYWLFFAIILGIITSLLWRRNQETHLKFRIRAALAGFTMPNKIALGLCTLLFLVCAGTIYYNKYSLNIYLSKDKILEMRADYEKKYARYRYIVQPKLKHVSLQVDLFPERRAAYIKGFYTLRNLSTNPIDTIFVNLSNRKINKVNRLDFSKPAFLLDQCLENDIRIFKLSESLYPGEDLNLEFDLEALMFGFTENNPKNELLTNGSCLVFTPFESESYFPVIGYNWDFELSDNYQREKYGLPKRPPLPTLKNARESTDSFMTYDAVISTDAEQIAISNGACVAQWKQADRSYFHYQSDIPMYSDFAIISGIYQVARKEHNGIAVEIYYDKKHPWNMPRIMKGMCKGIDYCARHFYRYPFSVFRVVEVPNYHQFGAGGLPSLIIWNEDAGFISNVEDAESVDQLFGITAHEVAHNWWPGMVLSSVSEGNILLDETIAQHVRNMCLQAEYGPVMTREHLKKEREDYLRLRSRDLVGERPLMKSYYNYYMTYAKSSLVMYALQDYLGEACVNRALKNLLSKNMYKETGELTSLDFLKEMRAVTPDTFQYVIDDLFEQITLYENKAVSADYHQLVPNKYRVNLTVSCRKFRADSVGNQSEIAVNDYITIAVFGENDQELYFKKHKIDKNHTKLAIVVDEKPVTAGIDPYCILVDRTREDNRISVTNF
jgi:ABC-2 type transport system permease protein